LARPTPGGNGGFGTPHPQAGGRSLLGGPRGPNLRVPGPARVLGFSTPPGGGVSRGPPERREGIGGGTGPAKRKSTPPHPPLGPRGFSGDPTGFLGGPKQKSGVFSGRFWGGGGGGKRPLKKKKTVGGGTFGFFKKFFFFWGGGDFFSGGLGISLSAQKIFLKNFPRFLLSFFSVGGMFGARQKISPKGGHFFFFFFARYFFSGGGPIR